MNNNTEKDNKIYLTFTAREKGYVSIIDKDRIKYYSKLKCDGFYVLYSSTYKLEYAITEKLLRKIKLLKLNDQLKNGNVYKNILEIIDLSKKTITEECNWELCDYRHFCYDYEIEENKRNQMKYQNRYFNKLKKINFYHKLL